MKANFSAAAKRYLDTKAEEFGAQRRDDKELGAVLLLSLPHFR